MAIDKREAIAMVAKTAGRGHVVIEEDILERDYGWVIWAPPELYAKTRDPRHMPLGEPYYLVERATGRLIELSSRFDSQQSLAMYQAGAFEFDNADIVIRAVADLDMAIAGLAALQKTFVVAEVVSGDTWRIPQTFSEQQLRDRLAHLPCRFNIGPPSACWSAVDALKLSDCVQFCLVANSGFTNAPVGGAAQHD